MNYRRRQRGLLPPVVKWLLIVNVSLFAAAYLFHIFRLGDAWFALALDRHLPLNSEITQLRPWQFITYQFLHADFMHIGLNMFALWMLGSEVEERWGYKRFLSYYLTCGVGGALLHLGATYAFGWQPSRLIGASGAVAGVLLAFGLMFPNRLILFIFIPLPARLLVLVYAAVETARALATAGGYVVMNVAHFAHLGGILVGYLYFKMMKPDPPRIQRF